MKALVVISPRHPCKLPHLDLCELLGLLLLNASTLLGLLLLSCFARSLGFGLDCRCAILSFLPGSLLRGFLLFAFPVLLFLLLLLLQTPQM
jgi:hypothetical protein